MKKFWEKNWGYVAAAFMFLVFLLGWCSAAHAQECCCFGSVSSGGLGGSATGDIDMNGNLIYDSTQAIDIGTAASTGHSLATGDAIFGGDVEIDGTTHLDGALECYADIDMNGATVTDSTQVLSLGTACTTARSGVAGDVCVGTPGQFEVQAPAYFDGQTTHGAALNMYNVLNMFDDRAIRFGNSYDATIFWSATPNPDALVIGLGADSRILYLIEDADKYTAWTFAQQTNPTLVIQSADATTEAQRIFFAHDQTDGVIGIETGGLSITDGTDEMYWSAKRFGASEVEAAASGATLQVTGTSSLNYLLDATTEYLYFSTKVGSDWVGDEDIAVVVRVALNAAETANDTIQAEVVTEYFTEHDDMDTSVKTQTRSINHDVVSDNGQGLVHDLVFVLDYDLVDNVIEAEDILTIRFRLDSVGGGTDVAAVRFLSAAVKYRTGFPAEAVGTFPSEG